MFSIRSLSKEYAKNGQTLPVFADIRFNIPQGRFVSIVGPSGCGKTTLLRCLAGLDRATSGDIAFNNAAVDGPCKGVTMVFQDYVNSLLPWKTVLGNVIFGMERDGRPKKLQKELAERQLESMGLALHGAHHPWELSGGMQQRLAIARALAGGAECLLMDEPFASLDAQTRADLEDLLLSIWNDGKRTVVFVTHDVDEAIYLSDQVLVLGSASAREPSMVLGEVDIPLPRPRRQLPTRADPLFSRLRETIHNLLGRTGPA